MGLCGQGVNLHRVRGGKGKVLELASARVLFCMGDLLRLRWGEGRVCDVLVVVANDIFQLSHVCGLVGHHKPRPLLQCPCS